MHFFLSKTGDRMKLLKMWALLLTLFITIQAANVITWVPPYNMQTCEQMLASSFGGVPMTDGITHVALQFWLPNPNDGSIHYATHEWQTPSDADVHRIRNNMQAKGIKTLLCVYNNDGTWNWSLVKPIIDNASKRTNFVNALVAKMEALNLDGVEIDLEAPATGTNDDKANFMAFMQELITAVHAKGKEVTIATFAYIWNQPNQAWWNDLLAMGIDGITSMGYEEMGMSASGWAAYSSQKAALNNPDLLMLGMPTYAGGSWQGNTVLEQVSWAADNGVGIGIWDCSLADGNGTANSAWRTGAVWSKISEIKGNIIQHNIVSSKTGNGTITPSGTVVVKEGSSKTFTFTPHTGYKVDSVKVDGAKVAPTESYTFSNVRSSHTIQVWFGQFSGQIFTINASAGSNGTISPSGSVSVNEGSSQSFSISAHSGYVINDVIVDGNSVGAVSNYTFNTVSTNHSISASFALSGCTDPDWDFGTEYCSGAVVSHNGHRWEALWCTVSEPGQAEQGQDGNPVYPWKDLGECTSTTPVYAITASAGSNGSISPSGSIMADEGSSKTFTITPNSGYQIAQITVDGSNIGALTSYTFTNIKANHSINAAFELIPVPTYTIVADVAGSGSISPAGETVVNQNGSATFTMTADAYARLDSVIIDGSTNIGVASSYSFSNVSANHSIVAFFGRGECDAALWKSGRYHRDAIVSHNGHEWLSVSGNNRQEPGAGSKWEDLGSCSTIGGPDTTTASTTTHLIGKDTTTTIDSSVNVEMDTIVTTTVSETTSDTTVVTTDSLEDGVVFNTSVDTTDITVTTTILSTMIDTLHRPEVITVEIDTVLFSGVDTISSTQSTVEANMDTTVVTTIFEVAGDTSIISTDSLNHGVSFYHAEDTIISADTTLLTSDTVTLIYVPVTVEPLCAEITDWQAQSYNKHTIVQNDAIIYINSAPATATDVPPTGWMWKTVVGCDAAASVQGWTSKGYGEFSVVNHNDTIWINKSWTSGVPGGSTEWLYVGAVGETTPLDTTVTSVTIHLTGVDTLSTTESTVTTTKDTVVTTTISEITADTTVVRTDSLENGVIFSSTADTTAISVDTTLISVSSDTLEYQPVTGTQVDTLHLISSDTTVAVDSAVTPNQDTVVTTVRSEITTDTTVIKTDSLVDGTVVTTWYDTLSTTVDTTVISTLSDTLFYQPEITVTVDTTLSTETDTVTTVTTTIESNLDTVITTTTSEISTELTIEQTDTREDGTVVTTVLDTLSISADTLVLSTIVDTLSASENGDICEGVAEWDPNQPWTDYSTGDLRINNNELWECINTAYAFYEPSGAWGSYGWKNLGVCGSSEENNSLTQEVSALENTMILNQNAIKISSNPVRQETNEVVFYLPEHVNQYQIMIFDIMGNQLYSNTDTGTEARWNLTNRSGMRVASGSYQVIIKIITNADEQKLWQGVMGIKK